MKRPSWLEWAAIAAMVGQLVFVVGVVPASLLHHLDEPVYLATISAMVVGGCGARIAARWHASPGRFVLVLATRLSHKGPTLGGCKKSLSSSHAIPSPAGVRSSMPRRSPRGSPAFGALA